MKIDYVTKKGKKVFKLKGAYVLLKLSKIDRNDIFGLKK